MSASLLRGLRILEMLAQEPVGVSELARRLEVDKAGVSRVLASLHREGWVAVRAMVPRDGAQRLMDELWEIGARGILVTDIHACRL